jgi:ribosomal-protein-alanine N-acetyltransferase
MHVIAKSTKAAATVKPESVRVRSAQLGDLDALVALEQRSFEGDRMSRGQYRRHLRSDSAHVLIASQPGPPEQIAGSAVVFFRRTSTTARLYSLAVQPHARGGGIGVALLDAAAALAARRGCRTLRLEVRSDNHPAIRLYQRYGFGPIGRIDAYYEDGADALRYEVALPASG